MELPLNQILLGDCLERLRALPDESIDAVVTDPPYGLGNKDPNPMDIFMYVLGGTLQTGGDFMGRDWQIPSVAVWREVYRVLKPGGYVASFAGTRTFDLVSVGLRMAGFECRDTIAREFPDVELPVLQWIQSQGMPKSHNISKAIDKDLGLEREVVGSRPIAYPDSPSGYSSVSANSTARKGGIWNEVTGEVEHGRPVTAPASSAAAAWEGWGSSLKPSWEPILLFRKPFPGTLADNVLEHGTGGLNINATRVQHASKEDFETHRAGVEAIRAKGGSRDKSWKNSSDLSGASEVTSAGRWPANCLLEHSDRCQQTGTQRIKGSHAAVAKGQAPVTTRKYPTASGQVFGKYGDRATTSHVGLDGLEEVPAWICVEGCPVAELNAQSGDRPSTLTGRADPDASHEHPGTEMNPNSTFLGERTHLSRVYADGGGAARFFTQFEGEKGGRWPSNVVLEHSEGCKHLGLRRVKGITGGTKPPVRKRDVYDAAGGYNSQGAEQPAVKGYAGEDGKEDIDAWECVEGCPVKALDEQGVETGSHVAGNKAPETNHVTGNKVYGGFKPMRNNPDYHADEGGVSRFFQQFEGAAAAEYECVEGCPVKALDDQSGVTKSHGATYGSEPGEATKAVYGRFASRAAHPGYDDEAGASRFFSQFDGVPFKYVPKANRKEAGCGEFEVQHITLKPLALIRWIVKLVTRKGGLVLDMYTGSGTTCHAAVLEGMQFIGIERDPDSHAEALRRLEVVLRLDEERRDAEELREFAMGRG